MKHPADHKDRQGACLAAAGLEGAEKFLLSQPLPLKGSMETERFEARTDVEEAPNRPTGVFVAHWQAVQVVEQLLAKLEFGVGLQGAHDHDAVVDQAVLDIRVESQPCHERIVEWAVKVAGSGDVVELPLQSTETSIGCTEGDSYHFQPSSSAVQSLRLAEESKRSRRAGRLDFEVHSVTALEILVRGVELGLCGSVDDVEQSHEAHLQRTRSNPDQALGTPLLLAKPPRRGIYIL
jgi:hypothetical protein